MALKQLDALRLAKTKPWYKDNLYLSTWSEYRGTRYCILTPDDIIGWGFTWEKAIADADRRHANTRAKRA